MIRLIPVFVILLLTATNVGAEAALTQVTFGYTAAGERIDLKGWLYGPDDGATHSALVLMHGCSGIESNHHAWARRFADQGYVALVVDGFTTRAIDHVCTAATFLKLSYRARMADAYAAAAYLRSLPTVDPGRIGVIGWSHGGIIALKLAVAPDVLGQWLDVPVEPFRAVVAIYPYCGVNDGDVTVPLLVLIGSADDWTPARLCESFARLQNLERPAVDLVIYPGATHSFDAPAVGEGMSYLGHVLRYDADVTADSAERIAAFLTANLN